MPAAPEGLDEAGRGDARLRDRHDQSPVAGLLHAMTSGTLATSCGSIGCSASTWITSPPNDAAAQLLRRVEGDQLPLGQQRDPVAVLRLGDVLGGDQQGPALVAHGAQLVPDGAPQQRVDAGRRLVDEQDLGVVDDGTGQLQAPLHPARQVAGTAIARVP